MSQQFSFFTEHHLLLFDNRSQSCGPLALASLASCRQEQECGLRDKPGGDILNWNICLGLQYKLRFVLDKIGD